MAWSFSRSNKKGKRSILPLTPAPQTPIEEPLCKYHERTRSIDFQATALQQLCWLNGNFVLLKRMTFFGHLTVPNADEHKLQGFHSGIA
jgi:hypothetical protein